ncbi:MAG: GDP-L-fucose synthase [Sphingobacteriales bacterium]|jgi:GDP-L-fucose synthase|nr:MAG: GDP-L-fucose synthase [Sphingobacteriales bacterium]
MTLKKDDKIFVAGHRGLIGQAIVHRLNESGYNNIVTRTRSELDLSKTELVQSFLKNESPDVVFIAAAKVGGILANDSFRADFLFENLVIQNNIIWGSHLANVRRVIFLGSSCIYPKFADQPIHEKSLLTGVLETTNQPYAIAKIAGLELIESLRRQYQRDYLSLMPTNLYGPGDNFDLQNSHVLPALVRKIQDAKSHNVQTVEIWGSGRPLREFMYSADCADAIVHVAEHCDFDYFNRLGYSHINIGTGQEVSINGLANQIAEVVGYEGELTFNTERPDGTPRKLLDSTNLKNSGWSPNFTLERGLRLTVDWYNSNYTDSVKKN